MQSDAIVIDLGDEEACCVLDSVERWSWESDSVRIKACPDCHGCGTVKCEECNGTGTCECNMGHEHDCEECTDGLWECETCNEGDIEDPEAVDRIVLRFGSSWQCDVDVGDMRGSSCGRDSAQEAFDAAYRDAVVQVVKALRRAA